MNVPDTVFVFKQGMHTLINDGIKKVSDHSCT
jgi:hypothetical protein